MATFINYGEGEEDATVQGAEWLQRVIQQKQGMDEESKFIEKFRELYLDHESHRFDYGPVFDLFVDYSEDLFAAIPETRGEDRVKEVESFFALVISMLLLLEDAEHLDRSTSRLCKLFSASKEEHPELRLRLLMMLYNTFNNPTFQFRYRIFKGILDYSAFAGLFDQVLPYLDYLDAWMVDWDPYLTADDKRQLFIDISVHMRSMGKRQDAFLYLKRHLLLYQGETEKNLVKAESPAVQLVQDAVQLSSVMQFDDLLSIDAVKALSKSSKYKDLLQLLKIFHTGSVDDLKAYHKTHTKQFEELSLSLEDCNTKIKLLTLATVALGKTEMPLTDVADVIQEQPDKVETWVVRALSEGVIDGRIDQLNHKVVVKSAFQRKFEKEEWAFLDSKLSQWIDNLENLMKFTGEQKKLNGIC
eukprot:gnl/TRDRNA2_/TRDRNA2_57087_c0_seq2.p1 gnl/TRDRNA2_/TRDRNA2_57087_c0~~gnl/TRDRNA2_/TRDRNA2_57087_c0_seq2.p1  ORF type:complete len:415 (+),score=120.16 gnl/TRDRNA2_/TRDRNA2_57087_c0_seq2:63-1307(+)